MPRILVAEDDKLQCAMFVAFLKRAGYETSIAENGHKAIELAKSEHPDLILMDLGMPVLDGWKATRLLRDDTQTATIPVLALTAFASEDDISRAFEAGVNDCILKPVSEFSTVIARIRQLLET